MVSVTFVPKEADVGPVFGRCGKKLGGLTVLQEKNAQVTIEKGCQIIQSLVQLRLVEQVRRSLRLGTSEDQTCWAMMREHFRLCTRKGVADPVTKQKLKQMFVDRHTKRRTAKLGRSKERWTR